MKLKTLVNDLDVQIKGKKELDIYGICSHSKQVAPGDLFLALPGIKTDGSLYIEEALQAGAVAILTDLYNPFLVNTTQVITKDPKGIQAEIARRFYKNPSKSLFVIGVTGTNGKTTTSYLIKHLLEAKNEGCGLIGTIETVIAEHKFPSSLTTPDVLSLNKSFSEMIRQGCSQVVMEVSSHALVQKRIEDIEIDVGIFTNLSQDHLDYHQTIEEYAKAKSKLFDHLKRYKQKGKKYAIINLDDPYSQLMIEASSAENLTFGVEHTKADVVAHNLRLTPEKSCFIVSYQKEKVEVHTHLIGLFNVYNCLAAITVALIKGFSLEEIARRLSSFKEVPGRLQKVKNIKNIPIYVDFAHTEKALENVLMTLRSITKGNLTVVFGCGGDRDKGKRAKMGSVAEKYADKMIFTSDNPRSEDPIEIIKQMQEGLIKKRNCHIEVDRKKAIEFAIKEAGKKDLILIAGKGHELTQVFKDKTIAFSDVAIVENYQG